MPSVQKVHDAWNDRDVVLLAISIDGGGMRTVKGYITQHGYTLPALVHARMETARNFGARGVPTTYVIDRQGTIVAVGFGPIDVDHPEFRAYLEALAALQRG